VALGFAKFRTKSTPHRHCPTRRHQHPQPTDVVNDPIEHAPTALEIALAEPFNLFSPHGDTAIGVGAENVERMLAVTSSSIWAAAQFCLDLRRDGRGINVKRHREIMAAISAA
jgi:hypothetical protein